MNTQKTYETTYQTNNQLNQPNINSLGFVSNKKHIFMLMGAIAIYAVFALISYTHLSHFTGQDKETIRRSWGLLSLLPTILVLFTAIISRRPFESMITGCVAGLILLNPIDLVAPFASKLSDVLADETVIWMVLVCGLMGGLIQLIEISGCLTAFSEWLRKVIKTRRQSLVATTVLGLIVFIDDYLNCLAVSTSMKKLTDYYQVSREKLAYIVDSTAAPMCVIVPISTWAVFFATLLEDNQVASEGEGLMVYMSGIPFMIYAWVALILVFLVSFDVLGDFGEMKKAETRAKAGQPIPKGVMSQNLNYNIQTEHDLPFAQNMFNFVFPMLFLVLTTVYFDIDLLKGALVTCLVTTALYWVQGILSLETQVEAIFNGFKVMLYPLCAVISGYVLKSINAELGMTSYVVESITPYVSVYTFPAVIFVVMAFLTFATASSWGLYVIALPIAFPVAHSLGVSTPLMIGALLSASSFGSHACFFSDSSLLAAQGSGCTPMQHAFSQFPYALIGGILAVIGFVILGFMRV